MSSRTADILVLGHALAWDLLLLFLLLYVQIQVLEDNIVDEDCTGVNNSS